MLDISMLRDGGKFSMGAIPRMALLHHGFRTTQLSIKDEGRTRFMPRYVSLGLLNLARSLEVDFERGLIPSMPELRYFDEDCYENDLDMAQSLCEWLRQSKTSFVLAGLYSLAVERTAGFLCKLDPSEFCLVVGGAHPTVAPEVNYAHIVVRGEGGLALRHLLKELLQPGFGQGDEARGICFQLDGKQKISAPAFDNSLATIPPPAFAYELAQRQTPSGEPLRVRWWKAVGRSPQIYICTQSCRARCTFCSTYLIHGKLVSRPIEYVKRDLEHLVHDLDYDSLEFHDDDLLQHQEFDRLMDLLARLGITWSCNARSEHMTQPRAEQMFAAGCRKVFLGVESLDQRSLDYYRKGTTVEMNERGVKALDAAGIGVVCGFILGAPHDTLESTLAEIDRMLALPIYFLSASILTPDIGTVEYVRAKKAIPELRLLGEDGSHFNLMPRPEIFGTSAPYGLPTVCHALSKHELNELYELACCEFFLRPLAFQRVQRLTPIDRWDEVLAWYDWMQQRAQKLIGCASLAPVRDRASIVQTRWQNEPETSFRLRRITAFAGEVQR